jgi:ubiquitin carboxyl-terminal hydrolase L5
MSDEWCTIESDPGVFTELLEQVGVPHVELDELWAMDDDSLVHLQNTGPVYGLIFLFKWKPGSSTALPGDRTPLVEIPEGLFFAHQVTTNACATQAILSVLFNNPDIQLGNTLTEFKSFTESFPPELKGEAIGASEELKSAHNSFARKDAFLTEEWTHVATGGDEDVFHFVAYLPHDGIVYELDGLQSGPIVIGTFQDNDWMGVARTAIQQRMSFLQDEIKFNLMAVIRDRRVGLKEKLAEGGLEENSSEYCNLQAQLEAEHTKRTEWKLENQRRRYNYVPLCIQMLRELAKSGNLQQLIQQAKERVQAKRTKKSQK